MVGSLKQRKLNYFGFNHEQNCSAYHPPCKAFICIPTTTILTVLADVVLEIKRGEKREKKRTEGKMGNKDGRRGKIERNGKDIYMKISKDENRGTYQWKKKKQRRR
jgi:hypothetical protein